MGTEIELDWSKTLECEITEWVAANNAHPTILDGRVLTHYQ